MKFTRSRIVAAAAVVLFVAGTAIQAQYAQQAPAVKRTILLKQDMTIPDREAVMVIVDLPPGAAEGQHTHSAEVFVFVLEGTVTLENEGKPDTTLKTGDTFTYAPGKYHQVINKGNSPAKLAAVFIAEKGKPLTTPVK